MRCSCIPLPVLIEKCLFYDHVYIWSKPLSMEDLVPRLLDAECFIYSMHDYSDILMTVMMIHSEAQVFSTSEQSVKNHMETGC